MKTKRLITTIAGFIPVMLMSATALLFSQNRAGTNPSAANLQIGEENPDKTLSPYFFIPSGNPDLDQLPMKSSSADVRIAGVIADVSVVQEYANRGKRPIEAVYVFPASTRAAVYSMKMTIGERTIIAKIAERAQARKDYEEARQQGKSASLLEEESPNVFRMNVANIMPGDVIRVEMKYTELLVPEEGVYEFVYPAVVGPRYSNRGASVTPESGHWTANPYLHQGEKQPYRFNINCSLDAGMPLSECSVPSHKTVTLYEGATKAVITLAEEEKQGGNRDFILKYRPGGQGIQSGLLLFRGEEENFFLAMVQPPEKVEQDAIPPREYIFIVDVSGSMYGYPIDISKSLMRKLIGSLKPTDRFNVLLFAGASSLFSERSVPAEQHNLEKAISFIDREQGGGGTELLPALQRALDLKGTGGYARTFVIATDGYVDVEREAFGLIRKNLDKASFFAFGIGTAVNRYLIEGMAHAGAGSPFIVTKQETAAAEADRFISYVNQPVLSHIRVNFSGFEAYETEPLTVPDVFARRPVIVSGKFRGEQKGEIILKGITGSGEFVSRLDMASASSSNPALRQLWARERIRNLDDFGDPEQNGDTKQQIISLGLQYNLLTRFTSFVAIDNRVRNNEGQPVTIEQPLPLPEGVSDYAVGGVAGTMQSQGRSGKVSYAVAPVMAESDVAYESPETKNEDTVFTVVSRMPEFPGGEQALKAWLKNNLVPPSYAGHPGSMHSVFLVFVVGKDGRITDVKVLRGVDAYCDREAVRLVKQMPLWNPGRQNGIPVAVHCTLCIGFEL